MRRMLTLTWRPIANQDKAQAAHEIKRAWVRWRKRAARYLSVPTIRYVLICEWTHNGQPHLHVLLDTEYIPQQLASKWWRECSGNPIVDIRTIRTAAGAAKYLSNYLSKDLWMPKKQRKYTSSRSHLAPKEPRIYAEDEEEPIITHSLNSPGTQLHDLSREGWIFSNLGETEYLGWPPQRLRPDLALPTNLQPIPP